MRTWTQSACGVLAWSIMSIVPLATGMTGSVPPDHANTHAASSTEIALTSTRTSSISSAVAPETAARPHPRYVVRRGDTLSAIAARFAVPGGWPALYAANRPVIGRDPNAIHPGTVLVLPGPQTLQRYAVRAGDTLSAIAAGLAIPGGWPALYAANRPVIGPDPNSLRPGTVLRIPRQGTPAPAGRGHTHRPHPGQPPGPAQRPQPAAPPSPPPASRPHSAPTAGGAGHPAAMPGWLKLVLLSVALVVLLGFLAEPVLVLWRRRRPGAEQAPPPVPDGSRDGSTDQAVAPGGQQAIGQAGPARTNIVLADYNRLVVTRDRHDDTVYVLRPPGADPRAILRVARLVLAEEPYGELARQLGLPALGPVD